MAGGLSDCESEVDAGRRTEEYCRRKKDLDVS
jgi:hypothetical protein